MTFAQFKSVSSALLGENKLQFGMVWTDGRGYNCGAHTCEWLGEKKLRHCANMFALSTSTSGQEKTMFRGQHLSLIKTCSVRIFTTVQPNQTHTPSPSWSCFWLLFKFHLTSLPFSVELCLSNVMVCVSTRWHMISVTSTECAHEELASHCVRDLSPLIIRIYVQFVLVSRKVRGTRQ